MTHTDLAKIFNVALGGTWEELSLEEQQELLMVTRQFLQQVERDCLLGCKTNGRRAYSFSWTDDHTDATLLLEQIIHTFGSWCSPSWMEL